MTEVIFEFLACAVDSTYLLYFYVKLIGEGWKLKKASLAIVLITCVQYIKEIFFGFDNISILIDCVIVIAFLFIYIKQKNFKNFVFAMIINSIFGIIILLFASLVMFAGVDISSTLNYGIERIIFTIFLKVFTIICFLIVYKPLSFLYESLTSTIEYLFVFIIASLEVLSSYVLGLVEDNQGVLHFTLLLLNVAIFIFFLIYRYSALLKKKAELEVIQYSMKITADHVEKVEREHEEIRKIRHDIKNQLLTIQYLLVEKKYEEATQNIQAITERLNIHKASISNNVYIDALLRQKMSEFSDIDFQLDLSVSDEFKMDGADIISLLTNIIDNACEELHRIQKTSFELKIIADKHNLMIKEENECRRENKFVTDKDKKHHGYGLKIMEEIVHRYDGTMELDMHENHYTLHICIPF